MRFTTAAEAEGHLAKEGWVKFNEADFFHVDRPNERRTITPCAGGFAYTSWTLRHPSDAVRKMDDALDELERRHAVALRRVAIATLEASREVRYRVIAKMEDHVELSVSRAVAAELASLILFMQGEV